MTHLPGLGATDTPVASGAASPASTLAHPAVMPVPTIGGERTPIAFVGLTPGLVGLYQMNSVLRCRLRRVGPGVMRRFCCISRGKRWCITERSLAELATAGKSDERFAELLGDGNR